MEKEEGENDEPSRETLKYKGAPEFPDGMKKDLDLAKYPADVSIKQPTAYSFKEPTFAKKM